jgi:hypothetical protein
MAGAWKRRSPNDAGLARTPSGGSGACVSAAARDGPPDFHARGGSSSNQPIVRATASCTA